MADEQTRGLPDSGIASEGHRTTGVGVRAAVQHSGGIGHHEASRSEAEYHLQYGLKMKQIQKRSRMLSRI